MTISLPDYIRGLEKVWYISDEFGFRSFEEHYFQKNMMLKPDDKSYVTQHYEVSGFMTSSTKNLNRTMIGRFRNSLVKGLKDQVYLPKPIVLVPDDDILMMIQALNDTSSFTWGKILHWLMIEMVRSVAAQKDYLPVKSKKCTESHFIWIEAPLHRNFCNNGLREKFNSCLQNMGKLCSNVSVLALKKIWNLEEPAYFIADTTTMTPFGYSKYWEAVDRTVQYCNTTTMVKAKMREINPKKMKDQTESRMTQNRHSVQPNDRFHWRSSTHHRNRPAVKTSKQRLLLD